MIEITPTEVLFAPDEPVAAIDAWVADMEAKGFVIWDHYSPVYTRIRMVPKDLRDELRELYKVVDGLRHRITELEHDV